MKILLVVGADKIGKSLLYRLEEDPSFSQLQIVCDESSSYKRVWKLIKRRRISIKACIKMFFADRKRKAVILKGSYVSIQNNNELFSLLNASQYDEVVLFRAGLVISSKNLNLRVPFKNVHCAAVPKYAGLGAIFRAIVAKDFIQNATMHLVTSTIDGGEVLEEVAYEMSSDNTYLENEDLAYQAGAELVVSYLKRQLCK